MLKINHDDIIITIDNNTISTNHGITRTIEGTISMSSLMNIFDQMLAIDNEIIRLDNICTRASVKPIDKSKKVSVRRHLLKMSIVVRNVLRTLTINPNKSGIKYEEGAI